MRSPNLHEIYERHLPFRLLIVVVSAVVFLLLDARAALGVARAHVHLEEIVELHRSIRIFIRRRAVTLLAAVMADRKGPSKFPSVLVKQGGHATRVGCGSRLLAGSGVVVPWADLVFTGTCPLAGGYPHPLPAAARHDHMPVVLDGVVGAAREEPGDDGPPVAVDAVRGQEQLLLFLREGAPVDPGVQLVEPPQPAALP